MWNFREKIDDRGRKVAPFWRRAFSPVTVYTVRVWGLKTKPVLELTPESPEIPDWVKEDMSKKMEEALAGMTFRYSTDRSTFIEVTLPGCVLLKPP